MKLVHDFFSQNGGGENLVESIAEILDCEIITSYNSRKKNNINIRQSFFSRILQINKIFVFIYFFLIFKVNTKGPIIFSGNHCCFSIIRCKARKKYLYAHSLPKSLFSNLYMDHNSNFLTKFFKNFLVSSYTKNLLSLDHIFFNSNKTKLKFLHSFPILEKSKINLEVLYPFSNMPYVKKENKKIIREKYFVINSRHQSSKNILHIILLVKNFLNSNKNIKLYITHTGELTNKLEFGNTNKNIIFTGYLNIDKYMRLISKSMGIIFPSRDEDFGISALDAYNLNIPVIVQKNCGFSEILSSDYLYFYDDNNLIEKLNNLIKFLPKKIYKRKRDYKDIFQKKILSLDSE